MDFSLLIPTKNRPQLLLRLISYYHSLSFRGKIFIGDSSDTDTSAYIAKSLTTYSDILDCRYYHLPGKFTSEVLNILAGEVSTAYVGYVPDDDFLIPAGIESCMKFLNNHPDYIAAHGIGVIISSWSGDPREIESAGFYRQPIVEEATATHRVNKHFEHYSVGLFSVHRTEVWREIHRKTPNSSEHPEFSDKGFNDELLQCGLSAVYGKMKQLDQLYLVRQVHNTRNLLPTWFDWIVKENWHSSYIYFRNQLAHALADKDGIPLAQAEGIVEHAFYRYLKQTVEAHEISPSTLRKFARESPSLRSIWHVVRVLLGWMQPRRVTLESLLNPVSPYNKDFLPVYCAVTRATRQGERSEGA